MTVARIGSTAGGRRSILDAGRRVPRAAGVSLARLGIGDAGRRLPGFAPVVFISASFDYLRPGVPTLGDERVSVPYPASGAIGDLILVFAGHDQGTTPPTLGPDVFTSVPGAQSDRTSFFSAVAWRATDGTEAASIALTGNGNGQGIIALRYRPGRSMPVAVSAVDDSQLSGSANGPWSVSAPSVDAASNGVLVSCWALREHEVSWLSGGEGMTSRAAWGQPTSVELGFGDIAMQASDQLLLQAGPTSPRNATYTYNAGGGAHGDAAWGASLILR